MKFFRSFGILLSTIFCNLYLSSWITNIFWSVLDEGISLLQEEAEAEDVNIQNVILFLWNWENLLSTTDKCNLNL